MLPALWFLLGPMGVICYMPGYPSLPTSDCELVKAGMHLTHFPVSDVLFTACSFREVTKASRGELTRVTVTLYRLYHLLPRIAACDI